MSTESPARNELLVSIICRTLGRAELQEALSSVASQDYSAIEIVLVDAAGTNAVDYANSAGEIAVQLVTTGKPLSRSQAANAGLAAAAGKYILFLDDDDWIACNHISGLVNALQNNHKIQAAYSSTQKTNAMGVPLDYVFRENFDPILLMRDNYIPIHAILFNSALLQHGCRFDEAFDIYEDWDFWLQLSQHTNFEHIDVITAFYREGGDSDTAVEDVSLRYQADNLLGKARAAIFQKWLGQWTGEKVNALIGHLDQSALLSEKDAKIHTELQRNAKLQNEIIQRDMQLKDIAQQLEHLQAHSEQQSKQQSKHISKLEQNLNTIYESTSWKLMGPIRRVGRALKNDAKTKANDLDLEK